MTRPPEPLPARVTRWSNGGARPTASPPSTVPTPPAKPHCSRLSRRWRAPSTTWATPLYEPHAQATVDHSDHSRDGWVQWLISRLIESPERWQAIVKALAHMADLGITDVQVQEEQIPPEVLARMRALLAAGGDGSSAQIPDDALPVVIRSLVFTHSGEDGRSFDLGLGTQSTGTLTWLTTAGPAVGAIARGDLLVVDELDASLHPSLAAAIVRMFKDPDINTTGAQILFSTHDTSLLGNTPSKILDPGEVWFCEKHGASSEVFSLAEFDTRASNNEQKRYLTGRFGALPDVDFSQVITALDIARAPQTTD